MRVLLDSGAYSQLMRGREQVSRIVRGAEEVLLPAVVLGELLYGFRHGSRYERNISADARFPRQSVRVTRAGRSQTTADRYSRIAASLRAKGRPLPTNDVWIAAHAMETGADLVSADRRFEHVDGIAWVRLKGERRPTWPTV